MRRAHNYKTERNEEIHRRRKAGETFPDIAKALGISKTRARDVFLQQERIREYGRDYLGWVERNAK